MRTVIVRTPYRISFFGGGTDHPEWFTHNRGAVLSTAIDKYSYLMGRLVPSYGGPPFRIRYSKIEETYNVRSIRHRAVRETLKHFTFDQPITITHDGDLPSRSGVGSSSSFVVGLSHLLSRLRDHAISPKILAQTAIRIERDRCKECVGFQDHIAAAYGGLNFIRFYGKQSFSISPQTVPPTFFDHILLLYTGIQRNGPLLEAKKIRNITSNGHVLEKLQKMVETGIGFLKSADWEGFGELLHESWALKRSLSHSVSSPLIDDWYNTARKHNAWGGKLIGSGGGGFLLLFASPSDHDEIKASLPALTPIPVAIDSEGSKIIYEE